MGEVYLVEHARSGELRAAKVMVARRNATEADVAGFRQEALSLLNVGTHPFIVRLFEIRDQGRDTVLFMEFVAPVSGCTTVGDYIARTQDYDDATICLWAVQFCVGMEHALKYGLTAHRDIKPGNLLVDSGAFLKIADFGLALAVSDHPAIANDTPRLPTQLQRLQSLDGRLFCGTPGYVAPELYAGSKASPQSDMFSFGVTLWQLAARSLASPYDVRFEGDPVEYGFAICDSALAHAVWRIDTPYFEVIRRCLAPDAAGRYSDFASLREAIKSAAKAARIRVIDFVVGPGFHGSFEDYVNRGRAYVFLGRYERALRILDRAVQLQPDSPAALLAQAEAMSHRGQLVPAVRAYEAAHQLDPGSDGPLIGVALAWLELGHPARARVALDKVLARHPTNVEAQLVLARMMGQEGNDRAALAAVEKVIAVDAENWRAHDYYGRAASRLGRPVDAARAFVRCLQINPLALDARLALASVLTAQEDFSSAEAAYEQAVQLFKENPEVLNHIAAHMAEHGHAAKAIELFQALAEVSPESRSIMLGNIGNAYLQLDDRAAATEFYQRAIKEDPANALAYSRLGDLAHEVGSIDEAAGYFSQACALDPASATYHASAGTTFLQQEDYDRAKQHLRRSLELYPDQPLTLYNLAVALVVGGDGEAAVEELAKAVRIDAGYARGWYLKAQIEARLERSTDAVASARQAAANSSSLSDQEAEGLRALLDNLMRS